MTYPISENVLLEALKLHDSGRRWDLTYNTVLANDFRAFPYTDPNGEVWPVSTRVPEATREYVAFLMKPRPWQGIRGWAFLPDEELGVVPDCCPNEALNGAYYVKACKWYDRCEAALARKKDPIEAVTSPAVPGQKVIVNGQEMKVGDVAHVVVSEGGRLRREQPWEEQARVAASAGYAQPRPPEPLSGTRTINGWAVVGFAVTEPFEGDRWCNTTNPRRTIVGELGEARLDVRARAAVTANRVVKARDGGILRAARETWARWARSELHIFENRR